MTVQFPVFFHYNPPHTITCPDFFLCDFLVSICFFCVSDIETGPKCVTTVGLALQNIFCACSIFYFS